MANEKVKLPKEVAEAIEKLRRYGNDNRYITDSARGINVGKYSDIVYRFARKGDNFDKILVALVNDYEVEKSPEEKLRDHYKLALLEHKVNCRLNYNYSAFRYEGELRGIENTLNILGITVEGINDKKEDE